MVNNPVKWGATTPLDNYFDWRVLQLSSGLTRVAVPLDQRSRKPHLYESGFQSNTCPNMKREQAKAHGSELTKDVSNFAWAILCNYFKRATFLWYKIRTLWFFFVVIIIFEFWRKYTQKKMSCKRTNCFSVFVVFF